MMRKIRDLKIKIGRDMRESYQQIVKSPGKKWKVGKANNMRVIQSAREKGEKRKAT